MCLPFVLQLPHHKSHSKQGKRKRKGNTTRSKCRQGGELDTIIDDTPFEVTADMVNFFQLSAQHRKERGNQDLFQI